MECSMELFSGTERFVLANIATYVYSCIIAIIIYMHKCKLDSELHISSYIYQCSYMYHVAMAFIDSYYRLHINLAMLSVSSE